MSRLTNTTSVSGLNWRWSEPWIERNLNKTKGPMMPRIIIPPLLISLALTLHAGAADTKSKARPAAIPDLSALSLPSHPDEKTLLHFAFAHEAQSFWRLDHGDPIARVLGQMEEMIARFAARGLDVAAERKQIVDLRARHQALSEKNAEEALPSLLFDARLAKRRLTSIFALYQFS
jgi:hypothetical protein